MIYLFEARTVSWEKMSVALIMKRKRSWRKVRKSVKKFSNLKECIKWRYVYNYPKIVASFSLINDCFFPFAMTQLVACCEILLCFSFNCLSQLTRLCAVNCRRKPSRCYIQINGPPLLPNSNDNQSIHIARFLHTFLVVYRSVKYVFSSLILFLDAIKDQQKVRRRQEL